MLRRVLSNLIPISGLARKVRDNRLTYLSNRKLYRLEAALRKSSTPKVPGSFTEFGIALGGSGIVIAHAARKAGRPFHGFDVFGMIPPPESEKDDEKSKERYKVITKGGSTGIAGDPYYGYVDNLYDQVCQTFETHGVPCADGKIMLHKGLFEDTLPEVDIGPVAFAHIDCDWYDPVVYCLAALDPVLSPGGKVVLDDYNDYGGCKTAVDEFLASRPGYTFDNGRNAILTKT